MSAEPQHRRHPLRLIVHRETQLRILGLVGSSVLLGMALASVMVKMGGHWVWIVTVLLSGGAFVSIWVSRKIAGPLYRIEKDIETLLQGVNQGVRVHLRQGDPLQHLADLVNQLIERQSNK